MENQVLFVNRTENGSIILGQVTEIGALPLIAFASWEDFLSFLNMLEEFCRKHNVQVPEAFTEAFENNVGSS